MASIAELPRKPIIRANPSFIPAPKAPEALLASEGQGTGRIGRIGRIGGGLHDSGSGKSGGDQPPLRPVDQEENPEIRRKFIRLWMERGPRMHGVDTVTSLQREYPEIGQRIDSLTESTELTEPAKEFIKIVYTEAMSFSLSGDEILLLESLGFTGSQIKEADAMSNRDLYCREVGSSLPKLKGNIFSTDRTALFELEMHLVDIAKEKIDDGSNGSVELEKLLPLWREAIKERFPIEYFLLLGD